MQSKYAGKCNGCSARFAAGAEIKYVAGQGVVSCPACNVALRATPATPASTSREIRVRIGKILFSKPDGSWIVCECLFDGVAPDESPYTAKQAFTVVGPLGSVRQGDIVSVIGDWATNAKYGKQEFKASTMAALAITESEAGLKAFLCRSIPHIGPARAEQLIRELGGRESVLKALESDPLQFLILEGITEERALEMQQAYLEAGGLRDVQLFASELGLTESVTAKMIEAWGHDAKELVLEDPYRLAELDRVGFATADAIAKKLKLAGDDPRRCAAATRHLLEASCDEGHTWTTLNDLVRDVQSDFKETGLTIDHLKLGVSILEKPRMIRRKKKVIELPPVITVDAKGRIFLVYIEMAERSIAEKLLALLDARSGVTTQAYPADAATSAYDGRTPEHDIRDLDDLVDHLSV